MELDGSVARYQHQLILLTDTIFSLGGRGAKGSPLSDVQKFDPVRRQWLLHDGGLLSGDSGRLAVTAFPQSGIDCVHGCRSRGQNLETFSLYQNLMYFSLLMSFSYLLSLILLITSIICLSRSLLIAFISCLSHSLLITSIICLSS